MRSIPGMVVMSPADDVEAKAAVKAAYATRPVYLRFGRLAARTSREEGFRFEINGGECCGTGSDVWPSLPPD